MAQLNKLLHIKNNNVEQTSRLYTTKDESGSLCGNVISDGITAYFRLGVTTDKRATNGRVKINGNEYAIFNSGIIPYHKDSYTNGGTYTWTCPQNVYSVRATIAGAGGGGLSAYAFSGTHIRDCSGGSGESLTVNTTVTPNVTYTIIVGYGGESITQGYQHTQAPSGGSSSFNGISARGGGGAWWEAANSGLHGDGTSYGSGGAGGKNENDDGKPGWVYIEYGEGI